MQNENDNGGRSISFRGKKISLKGKSQDGDIPDIPPSQTSDADSTSKPVFPAPSTNVPKAEHEIEEELLGILISDEGESASASSKSNSDGPLGETQKRRVTDYFRITETEIIEEVEEIEEFEEVDAADNPPKEEPEESELLAISPFDQDIPSAPERSETAVFPSPFDHTRAGKNAPPPESLFEEMEGEVSVPEQPQNEKKKSARSASLFADFAVKKEDSEPKEDIAEKLDLPEEPITSSEEPPRLTKPATELINKIQVTKGIPLGGRKALKRGVQEKPPAPSTPGAPKIKKASTEAISKIQVTEGLALGGKQATQMLHQQKTERKKKKQEKNLPAQVGRNITHGKFAKSGKDAPPDGDEGTDLELPEEIEIVNSSDPVPIAKTSPRPAPAAASPKPQTSRKPKPPVSEELWEELTPAAPKKKSFLPQAIAGLFVGIILLSGCYVGLLYFAGNFFPNLPTLGLEKWGLVKKTQANSTPVAPNLNPNPSQNPKPGTQGNPSSQNNGTSSQTPKVSKEEARLKKLLQDLASEDYTKKKAAIEQIGTLGEKGVAAVPKLMQIVEKDESTTLRRLAVESLGQIGAQAKAAIPVLEKALKDSKSSVKKAARKALSSIQSKGSSDSK